jgi:hypothetical protein
MRITLLTLTALFCFTVNLSSNIIGVPGQYTAIQAAINASLSGDTILVEPGSYMENINFRGKNIVLTSRYYLTHDPATIIATIINGSSPIYPDTASCVIISSHEDSTAVLQGFTITGGGGTRWNDEHGPGNFYREGGGILIQYSSPVIQNNIIYNNLITNNNNVVSTGGGGMRIGDGYPGIYNNVIFGNTGKYGAGVVFNFSGFNMKNNIICANFGSNSYGSGSGVWINGNGTRPKLLENNTIVNNSATNGTGGVYQSGTTTFRNNIIWGNIPNAQIQGGGATVSYCNIQGGYTGAGNIDADPMFADSNYILQSGSPCVDKGDSSVIYNDPPDPNNPSLALYPSMGSLRNDMGAYGGPLRRILTNQLIGIINTGSGIPRGFALYQNYPNPFNPNTKINFDLPNNDYVTLKIYDMLGKELKTIVNEFKPAGKYSIDFNATGLSSGVYFYRLSVPGAVITKKMILTK